MGYYDDKIVIKDLTRENAVALQDSHTSYGNPVNTGSVEIVKETDDSYTAIYDRDEVTDFKRLSEDVALYGGRADTLYQ